MTPHDPIPDGAVVITPTEMYAELRATHDEVRNISGKLDALPIGDQQQKLDDHESRIRTLERGRWPLPSLAAVTGLGALAVSLYQQITH